MMLSDFGKRIKEARQERGMSQRSLGLSLGLSDKTISAYESGRSYPTLDVLQKIAEVLDKEIDFFVCNEDSESNVREKLSDINYLQKELEKKISKLTDILKKEE